jgi:hypothetical protein
LFYISEGLMVFSLDHNIENSSSLFNDTNTGFYSKRSALQV